MPLVKTFMAEKLTVNEYDSREAMGEAAALDAAAAVLQILETKETCNMVFAAAPSQIEMLEAFQKKDLPWDKIFAFHMDEYVGLPQDSPQRFGNFLKGALYDHVPLGRIEYINGANVDLEDECNRYSKLLKENPVDIVCMGIGENGHIAFNDPHVADFNDEHLIKQVSLDNVCRRQQVHDGCFAKIEDVPQLALTLTIPALIKARYLFCVVPSSTKAVAVKETVYGQISEACPASVLRRCEGAVLYLDSSSSKLLK